MANTPIDSLTATWNNVATTFTAIKMAVTDTASAAASKLMNLLVGGVSKFSIDKSGNVICAGTITPSRVVGTIESFHGGIEVPANAVYNVQAYVPFACTINLTSVFCSSGTCTVVFGTSALGNMSGQAVSTSRNDAARAVAVGAGEYFYLTVSATAACLGLTWAIKVTRL